MRLTPNVGLAGLVLLSLACGSEPRGSVDKGAGGPAAGGTQQGNPGPADSPAFDPNATPTPSTASACEGGQPPNPATDITIDPAYAEKYTAFDLGEIPGLPQGKYGGLVLSADDDNTLLIGGGANYAGAGIYAIKVIRSACKHIVGFAGTAKLHAYADYIDGGLAYGPGNTLMFAAWPMDWDVRMQTAGMVGIIPPGANAPTKTIHGAWLGVPEALAALNFVPPGFPGEGRLKLITWEGGAFYDAKFSLDGNGRVSDVTEASFRGTVMGGPEGFAYVPQGSDLFPNPSMVVSEWSANSVASYEVTPEGDPNLGTRRTFLTGLSGAEGAFFDPLTGDFVFSTWNFHRPERLVVVLGFVPIDTTPR